jgi:hypothetical protein
MAFERPSRCADEQRYALAPPSWQARLSSCARTRVRATGAVIMIFHDTSVPAAAMPRLIGEFGLLALGTARLERATIIDDCLSHYSAISLDFVPTGRRWPVGDNAGALTG